MTIVLSVLAAMSWGSGDFFGGVASRRGHPTAVAAASQFVGMVAVVVLAPFIGGSPALSDMGWGTLAGVLGGFGLLFLYRGMAVADIGLVVPVAAIGTGVFPLLFGVISGERLGLVESAGLALAVVAVWLVSYEPGARRLAVAPGLLFGLGAGAGFGGLLVGLSRIGEGAGIWPLLGTRFSGGLVVVGVALISRQTLRPPQAAWPAIVPAGTLGVVGNTFFLFASQSGPLAVAGVIGSLFPAVTVLLARLVLREVLTPTRGLGLLTALLAVALISIG